MIAYISSKVAYKVLLLLAAQAIGKALNESRLRQQHPKVCKFIEKNAPSFIVRHLDDIIDISGDLWDLGGNFLNLFA